MLISMDKKYTLNGEPFTVLTVTKPGSFSVLGYMPNGATYNFTSDGSRSYSGSDLVEVSPYADFVIDEKVMVRDLDAFEWERGNFAGIGWDGRPRKWINGGTRWTSKGVSSGWLQCRRPISEELAE